jgi:hypothetical protein
MDIYALPKSVLANMKAKSTGNAVKYTYGDIAGMINLVNQKLKEIEGKSTSPHGPRGQAVTKLSMGREFSKAQETLRRYEIDKGTVWNQPEWDETKMTMIYNRLGVNPQTVFGSGLRLVKKKKQSKSKYTRRIQKRGPNGKFCK